MKEALRRAIAIRDGLNKKTGYNDTNITDGVNHLSTDNKNVFIPQTQFVYNQDNADVIFDPFPFEFVEYIQSSGTQYINTGYTPTNNTKFVIDFECVSTTSNYPYYFGAENSDVSSRFGLWQNNTSFSPRYTPIGDTLQTSNYPINNRYVIEFSEGKVYVNGQVILQDTPNLTLSNIPIYLFAMNKNNAANIADGEPSAMKLYSCQIYESLVLQKDLRPYKNKYTGYAGLMNILNNDIFINIGSGSFTPGPVISGGE